MNFIKKETRVIDYLSFFVNNKRKLKKERNYGMGIGTIKVIILAYGATAWGFIVYLVRSLYMLPEETIYLTKEKQFVKKVFLSTILYAIVLSYFIFFTNIHIKRYPKPYYVKELLILLGATILMFIVFKILQMTKWFARKYHKIFVKKESRNWRSWLGETVFMLSLSAFPFAFSGFFALFINFILLDAAEKSNVSLSYSLEMLYDWEKIPRNYYLGLFFTFLAYVILFQPYVRGLLEIIKREIRVDITLSDGTRFSNYVILSTTPEGDIYIASEPNIRSEEKYRIPKANIKITKFKHIYPDETGKIPIQNASIKKTKTRVVNKGSKPISWPRSYRIIRSFFRRTDRGRF